jgi:hypothetical protein
LVARHGRVDEATDQHVKKGIEAARERQRKEGVSAYDRLRAIVYTQGDESRSGELTAIIAEMEIDKKRDAEVHLLFSAIEPLIADEATEDQKKHAVALGVVAARLPHGQRDATIQKLISLASRGSRAALLQNLILSGESIDIEMVKNGLAEVFEAAKAQSWILSDGYELREWTTRRRRRALPQIRSGRPRSSVTLLRLIRSFFFSGRIVFLRACPPATPVLAHQQRNKAGLRIFAHDFRRLKLLRLPVTARPTFRVRLQ